MEAEEIKSKLEEARKLAEATAEMAAEMARDQAKDKLQDIVLDRILHAPELNNAITDLGLSLHATPEVREHLNVLGEHIKMVGPGLAEMAINESLEKQRAEIIAKMHAEMSYALMTDKERAEAAARNRADDEQRRSLDENLESIQAKFNERHPDPNSPRTTELRQQLDEQFSQLRLKLEARLIADRQRMFEEQERDRSR